MKNKKFILALAICMLAFSIVTNAEVLGGKWTSSPTYYLSTTDPYRSQEQSAISQWNSSLSAITGNTIRINSSSATSALITPNNAYYGDVSWNAEGEPGPNMESGSYSWADLRVNRTYMDSFTTQKRIAILTHEWGHILGLAHTVSDASGDRSIMYVGGSSVYYDQWGIYWPTAYDLKSLDSIY